MGEPGPGGGAPSAPFAATGYPRTPPFHLHQLADHLPESEKPQQSLLPVQTVTTAITGEAGQEAQVQPQVVIGFDQATDLLP